MNSYTMSSKCECQHVHSFIVHWADALFDNYRPTRVSCPSCGERFHLLLSLYIDTESARG